jgi:glycine cleavage system H protein
VRYTESHEWVALDGQIGTVGITEYAQKELGEIVYIELPKVGQIVKQGEEISVLESTKAAADVYAPVSGKVVAVNEAVRKTPDLLNRAAETHGWLLRIELSHLAEWDRLMSREQYLQGCTHQT